MKLKLKAMQLPKLILLGYRNLLNGIVFPAFWLLRKFTFYRKLPLLAQRGIASLLTLLILLSSAWSYLYLLPNRVQAVWYDDSWSYRQRIPIDTHTAAETNVYNEMSVDTATLTTDKLQADCDDLRFTKQDGQVLPYQIVSGCDTATTVIRVGFDTMPVAPFNIYMYYGNPSATGKSQTLTHTACGNGCAEGTAASEEKAPSPVAYWKFDEGQGMVAQNSQYKSSGTTTNLLSNPSFETNTTSWSAVSALPVSWAISTEKAAYGSYSGKMAFNGSQATAGVLHTVSVTSGTAYTVSGYINITSFTSGNLQFDVVPPSGSETDIAPTNFTAVTNGWARYSGTFTAASTGTASIRIFSDGTPNLTAYIDAFQVEAASIRTNYCDGSLTGNGTRSWSGTAHASTSTCSTGTDGTLGVITTAGTGPTWQSEDQCVSGKCLLFDGTNDYVASSDNPEYAFSGAAFTLSAWVRTPGNSTSGNVFSQYNGGVVGGVKLYINSGATTVQYHDGSGLNVTSTGTVGDNKWHHIAYVQASNADHKIYIDGVLDTTSTTTGVTPNSTYPMQIGATLSSSAPTEFFKGTIDEPKIYNFALTAAQIKANYVAKTSEGGSVLGATNNDNLSEGLAGYWKMDESTWTSNCSTEEVLDASGNSNHGESCPNGAANDPITGKFGNAGDFDNSNDYVSVDDSSTLDVASGANFTISAWINPDDATNNHRILEKGNPYNVGGQGYSLLYRGDNSGDPLDLQLNDTTTSCDVQDDGFGDISARWTHIAVVVDQTALTAKFYKNGSLVSSENISGCEGDYSNANALEIGGNASFYGGGIDELRFYNRAISPDEVSQLYNFAPGPVAYYKFEEKTGSTAVDSSGTGLTGTFSGNTAWGNGKYGGATVYDGTTDFINVGTGNVLTNSINDLTVGAWVKLNLTLGASANNYEIISNETFQTSGWLLRIESTTSAATSGKVHFRFSTSGASTYVTAAALSFPNDQAWHYVSATKNGTTGKIYVDGVEKTLADNLSLTSPANTSNNTQIGGNSQYMLGSIDELKVYNYARSLKQVTEDMNASHPAPGSPVGSAIIHYKFDEGYGSTLNNSTSSLYTGTLYNDTTWTQSGKFGKALTFGGATAQVVAASSSSINYNDTQDLSFSMWIKPNATDDASYLISKPWNGSGQYNWYLSSNGGATPALQFIFGNGGASAHTHNQTGTLTAGNWSHIAVTVSSTTKAVRMYVNGALNSSSTYTITNFTPTSGDASTNLVLGCIYPYASNNCAGTTTADYKGDMDEVKVYRLELTAEQVKQDMNRNSALVLGSTSDNSSYEKNAANQEYCVPGDSTSCAAPVGRWDFEEGTSTTANDKSGNGNSGSLAGTPSWTIGKVGKAVNFDGTDDWISVTDSSSVSLTSTGTLEAWIYPRAIPSSAGSWSVIASKGNWSGGVNDYAIYYQGSDTSIKFEVRGPSASAVVSIANTTTPLNTWSHVAMTWDGTTVRAYVNGTQQGTSASQTQNITDLDTNLFIGSPAASASHLFNGVIDQVRVFNYGRSTAQIAWDYNQGKPVAWWKFDECQGTTANDSSGNSNSGTITIGGSGTYTSAGTCASGTSTHAWYGGVTGKRNYSLGFGGTDDYVSKSSASSFDFDGKTFSVEAWVKPTNATGDVEAGIVCLNNGSGATTQWCLVTDNDDYAMYTDTDGAWGPYTDGAVSSDDVTTNWAHLVGVHDGSTIKLYVNGVLTATDSSITTNLYNPASPVLWIGRALDHGYFNGQIDNVRIYNYAVTATQVKSFYNESAIRYGPTTGAP